MRIGKKFRHAARFVRYEPAPVPFKVRMRLHRLAERLRRKSKQKGRKRGVLTNATVTTYWHMLFTLTDNATGACAPAIDYIVQVTGFAKQTVIDALKDLERVGLLRIMRRLVRRVVGPAGSRRETTVQDTNAYAFGEPHAYAHLLPAPELKSRAQRLVGNLLDGLSMSNARTESSDHGDPCTSVKRKESGAPASPSRTVFEPCRAPAMPSRMASSEESGDRWAKHRASARSKLEASLERLAAGVRRHEESGLQGEPLRP